MGPSEYDKFKTDNWKADTRELNVITTTLKWIPKWLISLDRVIGQWSQNGLLPSDHIRISCLHEKLKTDIWTVTTECWLSACSSNVFSFNRQFLVTVSYTTSACSELLYYCNFFLLAKASTTETTRPARQSWRNECRARVDGPTLLVQELGEASKRYTVVALPF